MFSLVNTFMFLFKSRIKAKRAIGEQYTISNTISELDKAMPTIDAGERIVYKYNGESYAKLSVESSWYL